MAKLSKRLSNARKALQYFAARKAFDGYLRRGRVPRDLALLSAAAADGQKFLDLCTRLSTKSVQEGKATTHYTWRTAGDDKVRHAHAALEGKVFSWSSPPEGGHPGAGHNCRCWAEPYYGDPAVPDSLLQLVRERRVPSDPVQRIASIETLTRPDGSMAASTIDMVDGTSINSIFQGSSVSQLVSFPDGASYQFLRVGQTRDLTVRQDGETRLHVAQLRLFAPGAVPPLVIPRAPFGQVEPDHPLIETTVVPYATLYRGALELYNAAVAAPEPMGVGASDLPVMAIKVWQGEGDDGSVVVTTIALTAEQVAQTCKRLPEIQSLTNAAARTLTPMRPFQSPQTFGTALHLTVHRMIEAMKLEFPTRYYNLWSELTVLPGGANSVLGNAYYGQAGSTRLDVVERVDGTTACVYDIKTGDRGLSMTRLTELTDRTKEFSGVSIVIVVQVNPE
ncbi:minor capsid protein [Devosia sp. MSA67]|uniref:Minor capsid protein n=1 Tax=Devosia sediminis TaxID=2798801 RepID=A0A934IXB0_9HYPH|nr:minor capsid protein [Devosia sediminis]